LLRSVVVFADFVLIGFANSSCFCFILLFRVRDHLLRENPSFVITELHFERVMEEVLGKKVREYFVSTIVSEFIVFFFFFVKRGKLRLLAL